MLRGRCLPYGDGITYFPILEIVKQAAGLADFDAPEVVQEKVCLVLEGEEHQEVVCGRVAQLLGVAEAGSPEETLWAVRRFIEAMARRRPLVVVLDDIHWAEPTLLDLVEHVAVWSRDVPILLTCLARPELGTSLATARPDPGAGQGGTATGQNRSRTPASSSARWPRRSLGHPVGRCRGAWWREPPIPTPWPSSPRGRSERRSPSSARPSLAGSDSTTPCSSGRSWPSSTTWMRPSDGCPRRSSG